MQIKLNGEDSELSETTLPTVSSTPRSFNNQADQPISDDLVAEEPIKTPLLKVRFPNRLRMSVWILAFCFTCLSLSSASVSAVETGWRINPGHQTSSSPERLQTPTDIRVISLSGQRIVQSAPAVADFNGDDKKEIVAAGVDGKVYVIDGATYDVMWEKQMANYFPVGITPGYCNTTFNISGESSTYIQSGVTVGDLNRDGKLEIVVATAALGSSKVGALFVLTYVGGGKQFALMSGWPRFSCDELGHPDNFSLPDGFPDGFISTPAVGDLDGNGDLEIAIGGLDRRLHAWHHTGQKVAGWPIDRNRNYWRDAYSSPALADIDRDGLPEVIIGTNDYPIPGCPNPYQLYAINGDGSFVPGFPVLTFQNIASSPAIGDIDGDGWLDIVVGTGTFDETCRWQDYVFTPEGNKIHAWDHTGKPLPGWPTTTGGNMSGSPALGDIDGDGDLEVIAGCSDYASNSTCSKLYAWHGNGSLVPGFPVNPTNAPMHVFHSPILADYDGDGTVEIMVTAPTKRQIFVVEPDGTLNPDTSRTIAASLNNTPVVDDIDGDNFLETIIAAGDSAGKGAIYIWDEVGSIYSSRPWPMFHHDSARSGLYTTPLSPQLAVDTEVRFLHQQGSGEQAVGYITIENKGIGKFDWEITNLGVPNLQIKPSSGTLSKRKNVKLIVDTAGYTLNTWHYLGDLSISATAFGQPVQSSPRTVAVWLYTGDLAQIYFPAIFQ